MAQIPIQKKTTRHGSPFSIRTARPDDAAALVAYIQTVAQNMPFFLMEADELAFTEEQERKWIQDHLDHTGWLVLLAELSGEVVGVLSFENGPYRRVAHRGSFGVSVVEQCRGQGIGSSLIETVLQWAAETPFLTKVGMEVFADNENAIRLYKQLGFVVEGVKSKDFQLDDGRYVDAVVMGRLV